MGMADSIPLYTVDDLDLFPDDGNRYELLDGVLIVTPAPSQLHQIIAARLIVAIGIHVPAHVSLGRASFPARRERSSSPMCSCILLAFRRIARGRRSRSIGSPS